MMSAGRIRALASGVAATVGFGFVWTTIEILRQDPERRLLVLWLLSLVVAATSVAIVVCLYMRSVKKESRARAVDTLVSAVDHGRQIYRDE